MASNLVIKIDGDTSPLETKLSSAGKTAQKAFAAATATVTALGVAATAVGKQFEQAFANTSTIFGDVQVDTDNLKNKIIDLSNESGLAADSITNSLYNAISAGIPVTEDMAESMEFIEKSTKLAKAGFTDVDTAVTATAKVMNAYNMTVEETDKIQKIMLQTQNKGKLYAPLD